MYIAPVSGGTGATSLTTNGILYGGTTVSATSAGTQYQVLQAGSAGVPAFGALNLGQSAAITGILLALKTLTSSEVPGGT